MRNLWVMALTVLMTVGMAGAMPDLGPQDPDGPPPPGKKKGEPKKGAPGPEGDLRRAYDLLRKIRAGGDGGGRADERLGDWTSRATDLYRRGVKAFADGDRRQAGELGIAAHDLARAVDHARNAARSDQADAKLPPPPGADGPAGDAAQARRDLRHAYDRIAELREDEDEGEGEAAKFYLDGASDLYTAARRDAEDGRHERAAELAKAAEALTHVPEHLARAEDDTPEPPKREPRDKAKKKEFEPKKKEADAKKKRDAAKKKEADDEDGPDGPLPPPLKPRG